jgi:hypothetical protein
MPFFGVAMWYDRYTVVMNGYKVYLLLYTYESLGGRKLNVGDSRLKGGAGSSGRVVPASLKHT